MQHVTLEVGAFAANCHIVWEDPAKALVVDPGAEQDALLDALRNRDLHPAAILLTHGHLDHLSALPAVLAALPCPVYLSPRDAVWCFTKANSFPPYTPVLAPPPGLRPVADLSAADLGGIRAEILETPGHSPGSVCIRLSVPSDDDSGLLITGDTLFAGSIGRTDFEGGDWHAMAESLRRLASLPPALVVLPGHGPATTIGREILTNPFLKGIA